MVEFNFFYDTPTPIKIIERTIYTVQVGMYKDI